MYNKYSPKIENVRWKKAVETLRERPNIQRWQCAKWSSIHKLRMGHPAHFITKAFELLKALRGPG